MLKAIRRKNQRVADVRIAIVASRYNAVYVNGMLRAAKAELEAAGAKVRVVRVPGAFEIPAVASRLAARSAVHRTLHAHPASRLSAIICFGVVFQGETSHAQHIGWGVTHALAQVQVVHQIPVIHGVFVFEKQKHARVRCLGPKHNRGTEAAQTALAMARVMGTLG